MRAGYLPNRTRIEWRTIEEPDRRGSGPARRRDIDALAKHREVEDDAEVV